MEYLVVHVDPGPCLLLPVRHELISGIFLKVKRGPLRTYQSTDHQALRNVKTMSDKPVLSIYNWSRLWEGYKPLTWLPPRRGHLILKSQHTHWPVMWPLHTSSKDWHSEDSWLFQGLGLSSAPTAGITYLDSPLSVPHSSIWPGSVTLSPWWPWSYELFLPLSAALRPSALGACSLLCTTCCMLLVVLQCLPNALAPSVPAFLSSLWICLQ